MDLENLIPIFENQKIGTVLPTNIIKKSGVLFLLKEELKVLELIKKNETPIISYKLVSFKLIKDEKSVDLILLSFFINQELLYFMPYNIHNENDRLLLNLFLVSEQYDVLVHNEEEIFFISEIEKEEYQALDSEIIDNNEDFKELTSILFENTTSMELITYMTLISSEMVPPHLNLNILLKKDSYNK